MISEFALVPSRRTVRGLDAAAVLVAAGFAAVGAGVGMRVWALAGLSQSLLDVAGALDTTGRAVGMLTGVPVVGDSAGQLAQDVARAAGTVRVDAAQVADGLHVAGVGVGAAIALLGLVPVVVFYLPLRLSRRRELRALRSLLADPVDPLLVEHLARVAVRRLPYAQLRRISQRPWQDLERGLHTPLAAAELRRLGVAADPAWSQPQPAPGRRP